jgi:hypothetical protein
MSCGAPLVEPLAVEVELLVDRVLSPSQVDVLMCADGASAFPAELERDVARCWEAFERECRASGREAHDGPMVRVLSARYSHGRLALELGPLSYRHYLGARSAEQAARHGRWSLANPLSVCVVVVSSDGGIVVEQRGAHLLYAGRLHVVGGYVDSAQDLDGDCPDPWAAMARECSEELAWTPRGADLTLTGMAYDVVTPHPELCFTTTSPLGLDALVAGARSRGEFAPSRALSDAPDDVAALLDRRGPTLVPSARAALLLHGRVRFGETWFQRRFEVHAACRNAVS